VPLRIASRFPKQSKSKRDHFDDRATGESLGSVHAEDILAFANSVSDKVCRRESLCGVDNSVLKKQYRSSRRDWSETALRAVLLGLFTIAIRLPRSSRRAWHRSDRPATRFRLGEWVKVDERRDTLEVDGAALPIGNSSPTFDHRSREVRDNRGSDKKLASEGLH
jgi:hypothetical protein